MEETKQTKLDSGKVIIAIPTHNEEHTVGDVVKETQKYCENILILMSKRSKDNTFQVIKKMNLPYLLDNGKGKGEALRCAINHIHKEDIIVFMDSDGSHLPRDIPKLVEPILQNKAEMVIGSRIKGGSEELSGTFNQTLRAFFSRSISSIINLRFNQNVIDSQNGFRAIKTDVAKKLNLKANSFDIETEMVMKCFKNKFRVLEVASHEFKRKHGESGITISRTGWRYIWRVFVNLF